MFSNQMTGQWGLWTSINREEVMSIHQQALFECATHHWKLAEKAFVPYLNSLNHH